MSRASRSAVAPAARREARVAEARRTENPRTLERLAPFAIVAAALAAYHNIFPAPFVFDDLPHIEREPAIRHLWPLGATLAGSSRPVVRLTLALNYAVSGLGVWSYHAVNLAIHALAGLALYALARTTLERVWAKAKHARTHATGVALATALIWTVHPLQTEAVTYTIQRGESLASLFYLLTILAVARSVDSPHARRWWGAAIACSILGMATKPVAVTAPILALAYDRLFLARSWRRLWQERRALHVALFATALVVPLLLLLAPNEWRPSSGLGIAITPLQYAATQPGVILHYLRLCFWPHPLCIDYGWPVAKDASAIAPPALAIGALLAATAIALRRPEAAGFLGLWFFVILAPTSSVIPVLDPAFEHRLYLPLAAWAMAMVLTGDALLRRVVPSRVRPAVAITLVGPIVLALGIVTVMRNGDYRSAVGLWQKTIAIRPDQARSHLNLAYALDRENRPPEALAEAREAVRLDPDFASAHLAVGHFLMRQGELDAALPHVRLAAERMPGSGEAEYLYGTALSERGDLAQAIVHLQSAVRLEPESGAAQNNLGLALIRSGRPAEAIAHLEQAQVGHAPSAEVHFNLGLAYSGMGNVAAARRELQAALAIDPNHPGAQELLQTLGARPAP